MFFGIVQFKQRIKEVPKSHCLNLNGQSLTLFAFDAKEIHIAAATDQTVNRNVHRDRLRCRKAVIRFFVGHRRKLANKETTKVGDAPFGSQLHQVLPDSAVGIDFKCDFNFRIVDNFEFCCRDSSVVKKHFFGRR